MCVREKYFAVSPWKLPGGMADHGKFGTITTTAVVLISRIGEDLGEAARREVWEGAYQTLSVFSGNQLIRLVEQKLASRQSSSQSFASDIDTMLHLTGR